MGRRAEMIRLLGEEAEVHPHYLETAAYDAFPRILRGGCMAAFEDAEKVTLVVETQKDKGENEALRRVCEGIRDTIRRREKVDVGKLVLVRRGSVPKTTSRKIMRWAAKDRFIRWGMSIIIISETEFGKIGQETTVSEEETGPRFGPYTQ